MYNEGVLGSVRNVPLFSATVFFFIILYSDGISVWYFHIFYSAPIYYTSPF